MRTVHFGLRVADLDRSLAFCTAVGYEIVGTSLDHVGRLARLAANEPFPPGARGVWIERRRDEVPASLLRPGRLVRLHMPRGNRTEALRTYKRCRAVRAPDLAWPRQHRRNPPTARCSAPEDDDGNGTARAPLTRTAAGSDVGERDV
jgi:hypothetical protein